MLGSFIYHHRLHSPIVEHNVTTDRIAEAIRITLRTVETQKYDMISLSISSPVNSVVNGMNMVEKVVLNVYTDLGWVCFNIFQNL